MNNQKPESLMRKITSDPGKRYLTVPCFSLELKKQNIVEIRLHYYTELLIFTAVVCK